MFEYNPLQQPGAEVRPEANLRFSPWLGRSAVRVEEARVDFVLNCVTDGSGEFTDPDDRMMLQRGIVRIQDLIGEARHTLAETHDQQRGAVASSLDLKDMPTVLRSTVLGDSPVSGAKKWLKNAIDSVPASRDWFANRMLMRRLAARKSDGSFLVSDETVLNVLQWHNYRMTQKQSAFEELVMPYKQGFIESVQHAAVSGWLSPSTVKNLDRLEKTGIYISDGTDTLNKNWAGCMCANQDGSYTVSLLPKFADKTLDHELVHVLEGERVPCPETGVVSTEAYQRGLQRLVPENNDGMKMLGETITEFTSVCLRRGKYPARFALPKRGSYGWGLPLVQALATAGGRPIDPSLFIRAHLEDDIQTEALGARSAMLGLRRALQEAFPSRDVIEDVASLRPRPEEKEPMRQSIIELTKKLHNS